MCWRSSLFIFLFLILFSYIFSLMRNWFFFDFFDFILNLKFDEKPKKKTNYYTPHSCILHLVLPLPSISTSWLFLFIPCTFFFMFCLCFYTYNFSLSSNGRFKVPIFYIMYNLYIFIYKSDFFKRKTRTRDLLGGRQKKKQRRNNTQR